MIKNKEEHLKNLERQFELEKCQYKLLKIDEQLHK